MASPRTSPGTLRERGFLVFGLGAALVLVLAASAGGGDPESAGRAELVSTAARVAEAVKVEWRGWPDAADWDPHTSPGAEKWNSILKSRIEWMRGELPYIQGHELTPRASAGNEVFDALFAKAEQVELVEQNSSGALELVLEAIQKTTDPARIAEARLRAIRLDSKFGPTKVTLEQYQLAISELDGSERKGPISYRLLLAEAIGPLFTGRLNEDGSRPEWGGLPKEAQTTFSTVEAQLQSLEAQHAIAWDLPPARLSLAVGVPDVEQYTEDPQTAVHLEILRATYCPRPWLRRPVLGFDESFTRIRCGQALANELRQLPDSPRDSFSLHRLRAGFLVGWHVEIERESIEPGLPNGTPPGTDPQAPKRWSESYERGGFASSAGIRDAFEKRALHSEVVPAGFVVDVDPPQSQAVAVREHDTLDGDFGFTIKHEDPEAWIRRSAVKQRFLRGALLVLAVLSAAAGVATFRALRRERLLATLKTDFVANVSHELRTPLASILLLSENLEAGRVASEADRTRYHALIRREALRLRRLVDDVLDFSRLERGKRLDVRREPLRVDDWLERACEELAEWAGAHALELAIERSPIGGEAEIDAEALRRALLNLLDNARKHSGTARVELLARREGRELVLGVRDHGRGIAPGDRERVFEPFTRLAQGDAPGAGLGLSIVREIVREHGGTIRALDPTSGPGIVFEMRIPLAEETAT